MLKVNDPRVLLEHQRAILAERPDLEQQAKDDKVLLLGLWIDGVPNNSDRSQTLETITLCLFGEKGLRVPLCAFPKAMRAKGKTHECIFEALAWSFRILLVDKMPHQRHTHQEFNKSDAERKKLAGKPVGVCAALAEMRGDWSMYKEVLDFPSWSAKGHICWLCNATKTDLKDFSNATFEKCQIVR